MMKLKVLGSSSAGNCYLLENNRECLMLEAGVRFAAVQQALEFDTGKIAGCLITHEHHDHSKYAPDVLSAAVDIYASTGTIESAGLRGHRIKPVAALKRYTIGGFTVVPFSVQHDAKEPMGFLIQHRQMGTLLFATDTYYIGNKFSGLNHILIECNYDFEILNDNVFNEKVAKPVRDRVLASHMEIGTCIEFLKANDLRQVANIILVHLSGQNGNRQDFRDRVMAATGKPVYIAQAGMELDIDRQLF